MPGIPPPPRARELSCSLQGRYFEDFVIGTTSASRARTVSELSGDFHELHMNAEYAAHGPFGRRIAMGRWCLVSPPD